MRWWKTRVQKLRCKKYSTRWNWRRHCKQQFLQNITLSSRHIPPPPRQTFSPNVWHRGSTRCFNGLPEEAFVGFIHCFYELNIGGPTHRQHETNPKKCMICRDNKVTWYSRPSILLNKKKQNVWSQGGLGIVRFTKNCFEGKSQMYDGKGWLGLGAFWLCVFSEMYAAEGGLCWFDLKETYIFTVKTASTVRNCAHERGPV